MEPEEVVAALAAWSVRLVQFNGLVADRLGVGTTELQCLYELAQHGPATPGALAARLNLTTGSASRMVERLHAGGHVRRVPDPADRRRVLVEPEPASLARIGAVYEPLNARLAALLTDVDEAWLDRMGAFLVAAEERTDDLIREL
ncbi:DNA-binding MarR family transcriptional regulator [Actinomycetospora succinea]|uniref:DNA-binding MarR family transcriptional regulator n=1 Tax=Actinomycetospora succinea TaxID=663603 RepID=A0A4R6VCK6_9PSEU|nr:MarR family transcriptional regulator [Actinomycetospora succinea]TDQ58424.1 DNA-binding MarR family transcriptional regulator [Actinomycetospora succinea]